MKLKHLIYLIMLSACTPTPEQFNIDVTWELVTNSLDGEWKYRNKFVLTNTGNVALTSNNWQLYFSQSPRNAIKESFVGNFSHQHLGGDWYRISPTSEFSLEPGETTTFQYDGGAFLIKEADAPQGLYFTYVQGENETIVEPKNYTIAPFETADQINRNSDDRTPIPTAQWQYEDNQVFKDELSVNAIVPRPVSTALSNSHSYLITSSTQVTAVDALKNEADFAAQSIGELVGGPLAVGDNGQITLRLNDGLDPSSYRVSITSSGILIIGGDNAGVFYGIQSILALAPVDAFKTATSELGIPIGTITDSPRYGYRGIHLDVARNFQSKAAVLKLIDIMAFYKLNKLHMHLTDDEGWRLEIGALPELTEIGAKRGHTADEKGNIQPSYGSGGLGTNTMGTGFYSRADYIEILQYAAQRHINVIPEINMPGHARAAIKAMDVRYDRKMAEGDEAGAVEYLLSDDGDQSEYSSAQAYNDNIVCVCNEPIYRFYETVVDEVIDIYKEAGVELNIIHTGGDEVPRGSWEKSPDCAEFLAINDQYTRAKDLQIYFLERVNKILTERGLSTGGWEEVAMKFNEEGWEPNTDFSGKNVIPYVWNNLSGNEDLGNKLLNADFPVVLCNVTNLYFDLAYNKDPREPGLYWGGFVDTRKAWAFIPDDVFKSTQEDAAGNKYLPEHFEGKEALLPGKEENILGIQAELWSETIIRPEMLEYYYAPKIVGFAERAWAEAPDWSQIDDYDNRKTAEATAWSGFAALMGAKELPRLNHIFGGYNYRIPPPGGVIEDGKLMVNAFPGIETRYTTDGTEPTVTSTLYNGPVEVNGNVVIKGFDTEGRGGLSLKVN
ncbi:MAG: carbohydate-binding domain-containing protein [Cyclobacteriaceae bacterium]